MFELAFLKRRASLPCAASFKAAKIKLLTARTVPEISLDFTVTIIFLRLLMAASRTDVEGLSPKSCVNSARARGSWQGFHT